MKAFLKISLVVFISMAFSQKVAANNKKGNNPDKPSPSETESDTTIKSNIVIFKIINPTATTNSSSNGNGSLKKAGKLARTSTSPHSSLDEILYKKRGI